MVMRGLLINNSVHTGNSISSYNLTGTNLNMLLKEYDLGMPKPKITAFDIPGADGTADFTESFDGLVHYSNRQMRFVFFTTGTHAEVLSTCHTMRQYHGQNISIVFDDDRQYYYSGRASVTIAEQGGRYAYIELNLDAFPYKRGRAPIGTEYTVTSSSATVTFENPSNMPVQLNFYVDEVTGVELENYRVTFTADNIVCSIPSDEFETNVESEIIVPPHGTRSIQFKVRRSGSNAIVSYTSATFTISYTRGYL